MPATIIQPGEIQQSATEPPFAREPDSRQFSLRADRFRQLATGHSLRGFLDFMGELGDAQQKALDRFPEVPHPSPAQLQLCREHRMPPLAFQSYERHPAWRDALSQMTSELENAAPPDARAALQSLRKSDAASLEALADRVLTGELQGSDAAAAPFVAAALQVYWLRLARCLDPGRLVRLDAPNLCPACGYQPVASLVRIGGAEQSLRYLHCALCATEWNMVRIKCTHCDSTKGIAYYNIEGTKGAVKAETCSECNSYLKIMYMEHDHEIEPTADDLATLALDILMDESGFVRHGPNLLLVPGAAAVE